jgi:hypothetical protein
MEVVACSDGCQPFLESVEVGFGLFDLGVGGAAAGRLHSDLRQESGHPPNDLPILLVPLSALLSDERVVVGPFNSYGQVPDGTALGVDPQQDRLQGRMYLGPAQQEANRSVQV